jgi:hypothetical protein
MIILDVFYVALSTIAVIAILQLITFAVVRIMYPPEPKIIYREAPAVVQQPVQQMPQTMYQPVVAPLFPPTETTTPLSALTQPTQEVQLPEYEPRVPSSTTSLRMDSGIPNSLQEATSSRS